MGYTLNNIKKCPFKGLSSSWISSDYGNRTFWNNITQKYDSNFHSGIDMTSGSTIVATARGKVTASRNTIQGYTETYASGNYVTLYHGNGIYTTYCHMRYGSVKVNVGDIVELSEAIKEQVGFHSEDINRKIEIDRDFEYNKYQLNNVEQTKKKFKKLINDYNSNLLN